MMNNKAQSRETFAQLSAPISIVFLRKAAQMSPDFAQFFYI